MRYTLLLLLITGCCFFSCSEEDIATEAESAATSAESSESSSESSTVSTKRMLWASINGTENATGTSYTLYNNKILVSWRLFPSDPDSVAFDLYRRSGSTGEEVLLNAEPIASATCFQDTLADLKKNNTYRLCYSGSTETLDTYTIYSTQASSGLPYISIPLRSTTDVDANYTYAANDASVGDLNGDGVYEIILKRLVSSSTSGDEDTSTSSTSSGVDMNVKHYMLLEAYTLEGAFLWRLKMGQNILTGNGGSFAVYDFDGDGKCEVALRTAEGTVFGDGTEIGDTNGDGTTDYRVSGQNYIHGGPEFLSVIDGTTGAELARADYIELTSSETWGDNYYKRSSSYRVGVAKCTSAPANIIIGRGCYAKIVVEAWTYANGSLTKEWRFDTEDGYPDYRAQGYHSFRTGDVDDDGLDEIVYGSCTIDHDGSGLNCCGLGHGDAIHLGKFDPSRDGLQIWACYETGDVGAALRDAKTGDVIWQIYDSDDVGRCMVADIDPDSPGCEMWWYGSNAHSPSGEDLGYAPAYCNMAIWWSGSLNRQLLDKTVIDNPVLDDTRIFSIHRYGVTYINTTKANPCFYGDILGDWREEVIMCTEDFTSELRVFTTWYPTEYRFDYLMSDHIYEMSALNENIGYNQPTHTGYYLGSDLVNE